MMANAADLLAEYPASNPVWADFAAAFAQLMSVNVEGPTESLMKIRFLSLETDDTVLNYSARMLGFDLSQDVLNQSSKVLPKLISQLPLYPDYNSTVLFQNFIDVILNAVTNVTYLWTKDYVNFVSEPGGALVKDGGAWFKTTHIQLNLALIEQALVLANGQSVYSRSKELFYQYAPAPLVIERMVFEIIFNDSDWLGGSALGLAVKIDPSASVTLIVE